MFDAAYIRRLNRGRDPIYHRSATNGALCGNPQWRYRVNTDNGTTCKKCLAILDRGDNLSLFARLSLLP